MKNNTISGIYLIKNKVNNKIYIGQAIDIKRRWGDHKTNFKLKRKSNIYLKNAISKYGIDNFEFKILLRTPPLKVIMNIIEIFFIYFYNSKIPNGYNANNGGGSGKGYKPTKEQINKAVENRLKNKIYKLPKDKSHKKKDKLSSNYLGVTYYKKTGKWRSYITINKKQIMLGNFETEIEAAKAYDKISWENFRDIKRLNFKNDYLLIYERSQF